MTDNAFLFVWRESSFADAVKTVARLRCRLFGHKWERNDWVESWDEGAYYREEWWECPRCEAFSLTGPRR